MATSQQIAWDIGSADAKKITDKYREGMSPEEKRAFDALLPDEQFKRLVAFDASYPDALVTQQKWASDGVYGRALGAVTSALVGGVEGQGLGQLVSNALAPYAAELIGKTFDPNKQSAVPSEAMQMLSHALLGALLAEANGGSAGSGALAAGGGELAAKVLTDTLFGGNPANLSSQQREAVLALSQAVGALAGGLSGQDLTGITLNAGIAKNSVENNWLSRQEIALMESERAACGGKGGDVQACKDSVTRAYDELNAERDRELLAYGAAVELCMRSYPATSEGDWKREWATRVDRYWEQYGVAVEDRVAGSTPGADAAFAYRQLKNNALASGMTAIGEIMDKGLDRWFMDKSQRNLEATLEGLSSTLSLMRGYVSSSHPDIYMQGAIDQSSVMTKTEEMAAYLAILSRGADWGLGALRGSWGIKSPGMGSAVSGTKGVIKASETIGQRVEAVIGGRKRLLRVDIEPNGKLQIQSAGGKGSIVDFRPDLSLPLAPQIDKAFKRLPQSAGDQLVKNAEKGLRRLQETGNM